MLLALTVACDRNIEPFQPGEEPSPPDLTRIFPAPAGNVGSAEAADAGRGGEGQVARRALPPSRTESAGTPSAGATATAPSSAAAAPIQGVIELAPSLASSAPSGAILFVIARPQGVRRGPPLAVLRVASPSFPMPFSIGPENVMIPSMQFAGAISLSARLDADGNAMTRGAEDLSSPVMESLAPGATDVKLVLSDRG